MRDAAPNSHQSLDFTPLIILIQESYLNDNGFELSFFNEISKLQQHSVPTAKADMSNYVSLLIMLTI